MIKKNQFGFFSPRLGYLRQLLCGLQLALSARLFCGDSFLAFGLAGLDERQLGLAHLCFVLFDPLQRHGEGCTT